MGGTRGEGKSVRPVLTLNVRFNDMPRYFKLIVREAAGVVRRRYTSKRNDILMSGQRIPASPSL